MWVGILLACAGAGAFIASRSNPFPPGVPDPGAAASPSQNPGADEAARWTVTMVSRTTHTYHVGGSCISHWRMRARIRVLPAGRVQGHGVAHLRPGASCDFPSAQVQARRIDVEILGRRAGSVLHLRFEEAGREPPGSQDLGSFLKTLPSLRLTVPERVGGTTAKPARIEDPEGEIYVAATVLTITR